MDIGLEKHENGKYYLADEVDNLLRGSRLVKKDEFMEVLEKSLGWCPVNERVHTFLDFTLGETSDKYTCMSCDIDIDYGRYEAGKEIELLVLNKSWVKLKEEKEDGETHRNER